MVVRKILPIAIGAVMPLMVLSQDPPAGQKERPKRPPRPGVSAPGVKREMTAITPTAVFPIPGTPDWQVVTDDAVWVSNAPKNTVHRLDVKTNKEVATIEVDKRPCSGLATGFGSVWVPLCGDRPNVENGMKPALARIDVKTNQVTATIAAGPANSEGGIAAGPEAVWMVIDLKGVLARVDPATNKVAAEIPVAPGSVAPVYAEGAVWVSSPEKSVVTRVDPKTNTATDTIPVGPGPRFLTAGAGSVWTLNQGDGTVSRVDMKSRKVTATIEVGIPGTGGELAFGEGHVWATVFQIPLSMIDPAKNAVVKQWVGAGGDSVRVGHGSVWLSNLREGNVWRIEMKGL
jgi:YVTN family beta-propeller protein